jgi:uncharacterized protein (TIGR03435 family)
MQCHEVRNYFADYVKEQLPSSLQPTFSRHLAQCAQCNAELERLTEVWAKLGAIPGVEPPAAAMNARFSAALEDYRRTPRARSRKTFWYRAAALAACLVATLLSAALFLRNPFEFAIATVEAADGGLYRTSGGNTDLLKAGARVEAGAGLRSEGGAVLELSEGSRIEMRSKAEMSLESADDGLRIRLNKGSVIVTAAEQRDGHLYVQTKDIKVSVTGTVFFVNAEEEGSRVAVIQGEVQVQQGAIAQTLSPGDQVATAVTMVARPVVEEISWSRHATEHLALLTQVQAAAAPVPAATVPEFEVAAIHPGTPGSTSWRFDDKNERVTIENMNLKTIIRYAYNVKDYQISGPEMLSNRYTITAKAPSGTPNSQLRPMLQPLLADRFKMMLRRETREMLVYALVVADSGLKMNEVVGDLSSSGRGAPGIGAGGGGTGLATMSGMGSMSSLADALSRNTDRPVLDRTGLSGRYSWRLAYIPDGVQREGVFGPSLSSALEDQGLKLERVRAPVEFLIIEHIEKPSEN